MERTEKSAESTKPVHKIEEFAKQGEKIPELVKSTETTPEQVIVEKPASTSGLTSVLEPKVPSDNAAGKDEVPQKLTPVSNELKSVVEEFPFQDDLKAIEKKIEPENESSEEKTRNLLKLQLHIGMKPEQKEADRDRTEITPEPLGTEIRPVFNNQKKESTPDPTIVNVKVDKVGKNTR
ncbi:MAG: hypothetical protein IPG53_06385 [Ignavibacteriales bacterium]|nr:hypothetical protein [Ignavibacteriales bacterium]